MLYGVERSTDSRDDRRTLVRLRSLKAAKAWRDEIGEGGVGPAFGGDNGHRMLRQLFEMNGRMPTGKGLVELMRMFRTSDPDTALAKFIRAEGDPIKDLAP